MFWSKNFLPIQHSWMERIEMERDEVLNDAVKLELIDDRREREER